VSNTQPAGRAHTPVHLIRLSGWSSINRRMWPDAVSKYSGIQNAFRNWPDGSEKFALYRRYSTTTASRATMQRGFKINNCNTRWLRYSSDDVFNVTEKSWPIYCLKRTAAGLKIQNYTFWPVSAPSSKPVMGKLRPA